MALTGEAVPATDPLESFAAWRGAVAGATASDVPGDVAALLAKGPNTTLAPVDEEKLKIYYVAVIARPKSDEIAKARADWTAARTERIVAEEQAPGSFIFRDQPVPVEAFVMMRGQYDKPGEKVEPAGPRILPPIKPAMRGARLNRLDLARWLIALENPLTARVAANRYWQQIFGAGLVRTSNDFGTQGEAVAPGTARLAGRGIG